MSINPAKNNSIKTALTRVTGFALSRQMIALRELDILYGWAAHQGHFKYFQSLEVNWRIGQYIFYSKEHFLGVTATIMLLAVTGAFETTDARLLIPVMAYWLMVLVISMLTPRVSLLIIGPFHHRLRLNYIFVLAVHTAFSAFLTVYVIYEIWPWISDTPAWPFIKSWTQTVFIYGVVNAFLFSVHSKNISFAYYLKNRRPNALETLLPANMRGRILAISAQDHYVDVTTQKGTHLIRMSLARAVASLPDGGGIQVHRSHWVEKKAIIKIERFGTKYFVVLVNSVQIPVSQSYLKNIEALLKGDV